MVTGMGMKAIMRGIRIKMNSSMVRRFGFLTLVAGMVSLASGCVSRVYDLAVTPPYQEQIGAQYELATDCYIATLKGMDELFIVNCYSTLRIPLPVDPKSMGKSTGDLNIKGVLPRGTVLKVVAIKGTDSFDAGRSVYYFLKLGGEVSGQQLTVNAMFVTDHRGTEYQLSPRTLIRRKGGKSRLP